MQTALRLPTRLQPRRTKLIVLLAICAALCAGGVLIARQGGIRGPFGYPIAAFFGLCTLVMVANLLPGGAYLEIGHRGMTVRSMFRDSFYPWSDIARFFPLEMGKDRVVAMEFAPHVHGQARLRRWAREMAGAEGCLPDTYGYRADELAALLNDARARLRA